MAKVASEVVLVPGSARRLVEVMRPAGQAGRPAPQFAAPPAPSTSLSLFAQ